MSEQYPHYPQYPADAAAAEGRTPAAPTQPTSVATAVKLMYAGAVLSVLSLVGFMFTLGSLKDTVEESLLETDPDVSQAVVDGAFAVTIGIAVFSGLLGAALWAWMAWKNGQGRSWARVVATVLAAVGVLFTLASFTQPGTTALNLVFSAITTVIAIAVAVLLWKKESSAYYDAVSRSRQPY